jgi:hypothetical protein
MKKLFHGRSPYLASGWKRNEATTTGGRGMNSNQRTRKMREENAAPELDAPRERGEKRNMLEPAFREMVPARSRRAT